MSIELFIIVVLIINIVAMLFGHAITKAIKEFGERDEDN